MASAREILTLIIRGDVRGLKKALTEGTQGIRKFAGRAAESFKNTRIHVDNLRSAFAALGVGLLIRTLIRARLQLDSVESSLRVATGSTTAAAREFGFIKQQADRLGLSLESAARDYAKLSAASRGTQLQGQPTRDIFLGIAEASTALGLSAEQTSGALTAVEQIISKGKVSAEELRGQLGERLFGAFQLAANSIGVTTEELDKMLENGDLVAKDLLPRLAAELRSTFGAEAEARAAGLQAELNRLRSVIFQIATDQKLMALTGAIRDLRETLEDPSTQSAINRFVSGIVKLAEWSIRAGSFIGKLGEAIGFNFTDAAKLTREVARLEANVNAIELHAPDAPGLQAMREQLAKARAELDALIKRDVEAGNVFGSPEVGGTLTQNKKGPDIPADESPINLARQKELDANLEADEKLIAALREEIRLAKLSDIEREKAIATGKLSADATKEQADTVNELAAELYNLQEAQKHNNDQMTEFAKQAARNIQNSFSQFWFDPFEEGLSGLVRGFANAIRQMIAESLALQSIKFLSNVPGFGFLNLATKHTGGLVNGGGRMISGVSPLAFAGAHRFHAGGVLGLGPDEVPIVGKRGEEMLTTDDPRHRFNGGLGGGKLPEIRIINLVDGQSIADAMAAPPGTKVILNTIRKNPEATRRR